MENKIEIDFCAVLKAFQFLKKGATMVVSLPTIITPGFHLVVITLDIKTVFVFK